MSDDQFAQLDAALEKVIAAARAHLAAVKSAEGRIDDDGVWRAYVELNNASYEDEESADDPHPHVVSVRQRRDYRIPSVGALIRVAEAARRAAPQGDGTDSGPVESVSEAVLELLQSGDGSLGALDVPELEPLDGIVAVAEIETALDLDAFDEADGSGPFTLGAHDRLVGRLDEHPYSDLDEAEATS